MVKGRNSRMLKSLTSAVQRLSGSISTRWLASLSGRRSTSGPAGGSGRWSRSRSRGWPATSYINKFTKNSLVITLLYIIKKWIMLKEYWNIIKKCRLPGVIVLLYGVLDFLAEAILKELSLSLRLSGVPALSEERDARDCPIGTLRALRSLTYAT